MKLFSKLWWQCFFICVDVMFVCLGFWLLFGRKFSLLESKFQKGAPVPSQNIPRGQKQTAQLPCIVLFSKPFQNMRCWGVAPICCETMMHVPISQPRCLPSTMLVKWEFDLRSIHKPWRVPSSECCSRHRQPYFLLATSRILLGDLLFALSLEKKSRRESWCKCNKPTMHSRLPVALRNT